MALLSSSGLGKARGGKFPLGISHWDIHIGLRFILFELYFHLATGPRLIFCSEHAFLSMNAFSRKMRFVVENIFFDEKEFKKNVDSETLRF